MYRYVGPDDIRAIATAHSTATTIRTRTHLVAWLAANGAADHLVTYVVNLEGDLVLAPRESEHVGAALGQAVRSAGEISFDAAGSVVSITNQSTGYCPEPRSWPDVAAALDAIGLPNPGDFTTAFEFRRCPRCQSINIIKDDDFSCGVCGTDLPTDWNLDLM